MYMNDFDEDAQPTQAELDQTAFNQALQAASLAKQISDLQASTDPNVQAAVATLTTAQTTLSKSGGQASQAVI